MTYRRIDYEGEVRQFLDEYTAKTGVIVEPPVPIELIVEVSGFDVLYDSSELEANESGRVDFLERLITIRDDEPLVRQRFSLGHEAGHTRLHRLEIDLITKPLPGLLESATKTHLSRRGSKERFEVEANRFSAAVLMPLHLLRPALEEVRERYSKLAATPTKLARVAETYLAGQFVVSDEVVRHRLKDTGLLQELFTLRLF